MPRNLKSRAALQQELRLRHGELMAVLGLYEMHAGRLAKFLTGGTVSFSTSRVPLATPDRFAVRVMSGRGVATTCLSEIAEIDTELQQVLARHGMSADGQASSGTLYDFISAHSRLYNGSTWFDQSQPTELEIASFVNAIERDIVKVASLYIRLANFASNIEVAVGRIH
jgi:hypothetical protein